VSVIGWCMGAALTAMYAALNSGGPVANPVLLTMPFDTEGSLYRRWVTANTYDVNAITQAWLAVPGWGIDVANKLMKPVGNFVTTYRRLAESVERGDVDPEAYQSMAKWVADNPPSGLGLPGVDHLALPGEPAGRRDAVPARAQCRPVRDRRCGPGRHRRLRPHRPQGGHAPLPRPGGQRRRDPLRPRRRAHRPDGRIQGPQADLARHHGVARRTLRLS
jgi:hypothetical protein